MFAAIVASKRMHAFKHKVDEDHIICMLQKIVCTAKLLSLGHCYTVILGSSH